LGGNLLNNLLLFLTHFFLIRTLIPKEYGIFVVILTYVNLFVIFVQMGLDLTGVRFISSNEITSSLEQKIGVFWFGFFVVFLFSILLSLAGYFLLPFLKFYTKKSDFFLSSAKLFLLGFPFYSILFYISNVSRGFFYIHIRAIIFNVIRPFTFLFICILIYYFYGLNVNHVSFIWSVSIAISFLISIIWMLKKFPFLKTLRFLIPNLKKTFSVSLNIMLSNLIQRLLLYIDIVLLSIFLLPKDVAFYNAAARVAVLIVIPLWALTSIFSPLASHLIFKKKFKALNTYYQLGIKWTLLLIFPIFLVIVSNSKFILKFLFGEEYVKGWIVLVILSITSFVDLAVGPAGNIMIMGGKEKLWNISLIASIFVSFFFNLILIPLYGKEGAALSMLLTMIFLFSMALFFNFKNFKINPFGKFWFIFLFSFLISFISIFFIKNIRIFEILKIFIELIVSYFIFVILSFIFGSISKREIFKLKRIFTG